MKIDETIREILATLGVVLLKQQRGEITQAQVTKAATQLTNDLKNEIKQAVLEAVGEDEDISDPNFDVVYYDSEKSPRNQLRREIRERLNTLFGESDL